MLAFAATVRAQPVADATEPEPQATQPPAAPASLGARASVASPAPSVRSLSKAEVEITAGALGDPLRALEQEPGVARSSFDETSLLIRGSGPLDTQVLLEDIPIPAASLFHQGGFKSFIAPSLLRGVRLYPSNFSVRYGRALGGVITASLQDPPADRAHGSIDVSLLDSSAVLSAPFSDEDTAAVAARRSYVDLFFDAVAGDDETVVAAAPVYWDYQALGTLHPSSADRVRIAAFGSGDSIRLIATQPSDSDPSLRGVIGEEKSFHRGLVQWRHDYDPRSAQTLTIGFGPTALDEQRGSERSQELDGLDFQARAQWEVALGPSYALTVGADVIGSLLSFEYEGPYYAIDSRTMPSERAERTQLDEQLSIVQPAAYAELSMQLGTAVMLQPGVRVDYFSELQRGSCDPRVAAFLWLTETTMLKVGLGRFTQPPPFGAAVAGFGNPDLAPAYALHGTLGVEQGIGDVLTLGVEGYYKRLFALPIDAPESQVSPVAEGEGRVIGLDLRAELSTPHAFGALSYSLSRSERRGPDAAFALYDYDQPHVLAFAAGYRPDDAWELSLTLRLSSGLPETPISSGIYFANDDRYLPRYGAPSSDRAPLYHRLDLRALRRFRIGDGSVALYLDVINVYDHRAVEATLYGFDYRSRTEVTGLPILPVLGVRGEL